MQELLVFCCHDIALSLTPTVSKTAQGAIEHIPIATTGGIPKAAHKVKELGVWTVGMDMAADEDITTYE